MHKIVILSSVIITLLVITGCSTVVNEPAILPVSVQLSYDDFILGKIVEHTIPYDKKNPNLRKQLYYDALAKSGYDLIILPSFSVKKSLFKEEITIKGYGAKLKKH